MTIAVSYHETVNVLQGLNCTAAGPFERPEWFSLLAENTNGQVQLVMAQDSKEGIAALPLVRTGARLEPLLNWYSFTFAPILTSQADAVALLTAIASDLKQRERRVTLWPLAGEDGSATMLEQAFRQAGWLCARVQCDTNHVLPVNGRSFAEYLASRPGALRTTLKRKSGHLEKEILTTFQSSAWDIYEEIYSRSWKPEEGNPQLLRSFAEQEGRAGRLRMALARHDGRPVAAQFWTV